MEPLGGGGGAVNALMYEQWRPFPQCWMVVMCTFVLQSLDLSACISAHL